MATKSAEKIPTHVIHLLLADRSEERQRKGRTGDAFGDRKVTFAVAEPLLTEGLEVSSDEVWPLGEVQTRNIADRWDVCSA